MLYTYDNLEKNFIYFWEKGKMTERPRHEVIPSRLHATEKYTVLDLSTEKHRLLQPRINSSFLCQKACFLGIIFAQASVLICTIFHLPLAISATQRKTVSTFGWRFPFFEGSLHPSLRDIMGQALDPNVTLPNGVLLQYKFIFFICAKSC